MNSVYPVGAPYGLGQAEISDIAIPAASVRMAPAVIQPMPVTAAPTSLWQTIKNVSGQLVAAGTAAAPALIAKITEKKVSEKKAKAKKPAAPVAPGYVPTSPASKGLPGWVIPVAAGAVALGAVMFFVTRKKRS